MSQGDRLRDDSRTLAECASRLGDLADRLRRTSLVPEWLDEVADQAARCLNASRDLAEAAARLDAHSAALGSRTDPQR